MTTARARCPEIPAQIGPYTILQEIGRGGQGVVYLARDIFAREVAIKAINADDDPAAVENLRREGEFLALLNHPNIARVYAPLLDGGRLYMVLEYVQGQSLAERLRFGPLPRSEAYSVCAQVALAADAAHCARIVHRDLKPSNIRLTGDAGVKVIDFGIAQSTMGPAGVRPSPGSVSPGSELAGTYAYMAPEQMMGRPVDHRADIWALACIVFECLVGQPLFTGATFEDYFLRIAGRDADLSRLPADTPRRLRSILRQCLVRNPAERLASIAEVVPVLESALRRRLASPGAAAPLSNLPRQVTSFIGRGRELAELPSLLASGPSLCITGAGGCGKTRLALELGRRLVREYPDGVWLVDLADRDPAQPIEGLVAAALPMALASRDELGSPAVPPAGDDAPAPDSALGRLGDRLAHARLLLIIDECDRFRGPVSRLCHVLLRRCAGVRIVATSRERLEIAGHQRYELRPLAVPPPRFADFPAHQLQQVESVGLFLERARLVDRLFAPDHSELIHIADLCRRLDGLPLGVEIAAARVASLRPADMLARLDSVLKGTNETTWDRRPHHWTIDACIRWSYDLLPTQERHILTRFAVFRGGWTLEAAESVCAGGAPEIGSGEIHLQLTQLVNKSLVTYDTQSGRYSMLESVKTFVEGELAAPQRAALLQRHFEYFAALARRTEQQVLGREQTTGLRAAQADLENFRLALADDPSRAVARLQMAASLARFWYLRGYFTEGRQLLEHAIAQAPGAPPALLGKAHNAIGTLAYGVQDFAAAERAYRSTLDVGQALGDRSMAARAWDNLAMILTERDEFEQAEEAYRAALELNEQCQDAGGSMRVRLNLGYHLVRRGQHQEAAATFHACLDYFRESEDRKREAISLHNLGEVAYFQGDDQGALAHFIDSLRIKDELGDRRGISLTLYMYALVLLRRRAYDLATTLISKSLGIRAELGAAELPMPLPEHQAALGSLRAALGAQRFQASWDRGHELYDEDAVHTITAAGPRSP